MSRFVFPAWIDRAIPFAVAFAVGFGAYATGLVAWGLSPSTLDVGYQPKQPVPFSHALHAGKLKMDCRYCHNTVEKAAHAAVPATATCIKCHAGADGTGVVSTVSVHSQSAKLLPVRESAATGKSIPWTKVHDLPDYAYFNHSAHVTRGVSCVSCHGRVDKMEEVVQKMPLSMSWCLDCHRNPTPHLRPPELVTALDWVPEESPEVLGARIKDQLHIESKTNCSTCHR
ncbi:cytochrome c3 family protein [Schlesneria paludicola]|uniref:cytochrome c3 family protein n=1 Tax=Schlesneria paludicola TaxID=360056 RepID=UPI00029B18D8|nr:cytochrome c3 family protein [Schlesneria paludicola]